MAQLKGRPASVAALFDVDAEALKAPLAKLTAVAIRDQKSLTTALTASSVLPAARLFVLSTLGDAVGVVPVAEEVVRTEPANLWAAWKLSDALRVIGRDAAALKVAETAWARRDAPMDQWSKYFFDSELAPLRCELLYDNRDSKAVNPACLEAYRRSRHTRTHRAAARWLVTHQQTDEALSVIEKALRDRDLGATYFIRGVVRSELKDPRAARASFEWATGLSPRMSPAWRCLDGAPCDVEHADALLREWNARLDALSLINASRVYRALGMAREVEGRIEAADRRDPGAGLAERLAQQAVADQASAVAEAQKLLKTSRHPHLLALVAIGTVAGDPAGARALLDEALAADPGNPWVNRALSFVCARAEDSACVEAALARSSMSDPREEAGSYMATQLPSSLRPFPPERITRFVIAPRAEGDLPEIEGLLPVLQARFPRIPIAMAALERTPSSWLIRGGTMVDLEAIVDQPVPGEDPTVFVLDRDGAVGGGYFRYGLHQGARGAVSVARFRSADGAPRVPTTEFSIGKERSKVRLQNQLTSTMGKMLGMSSPCQEEKCVLRFPRHMDEFDAKGGEFCAAHKAELAKLTK